MERWTHEADGWIHDLDGRPVAFVPPGTPDRERVIRMVESAPYLLRLCWKLLGACQRSGDEYALVLHARHDLARIAGGEQPATVQG